MNAIDPAAQALKFAIQAVTGPRQTQYGSVDLNWKRIEKLQRALKEVIKGCSPAARKLLKSSGARHGLDMIMVKIARICESPAHADSWSDAAGYSSCGYDCVIAELRAQGRDQEADESLSKIAVGQREQEFYASRLDQHTAARKAKQRDDAQRYCPVATLVSRPLPRHPVEVIRETLQAGETIGGTPETRSEVLRAFTEGGLSLSCDSGSASVELADTPAPSTAGHVVVYYQDPVPVKTVREKLGAATKARKLEAAELSGSMGPRTFLPTKQTKASSAVVAKKVAK